MSEAARITIAVVGIDIGKNSFHVVGLDHRGTIVLRQKWSRANDEVRGDQDRRSTRLAGVTPGA